MRNVKQTKGENAQHNSPESLKSIEKIKKSTFLEIGATRKFWENMNIEKQKDGAFEKSRVPGNVRKS